SCGSALRYKVGIRSPRMRRPARSWRHSVAVVGRAPATYRPLQAFIRRARRRISQLARCSYGELSAIVLRLNAEISVTPLDATRNLPPVLTKRSRASPSSVIHTLPLVTCTSMPRASSMRTRLPRTSSRLPCATYSCRSMAASVRTEAHVEAPGALARAVGLELQADVAQRALVELVQHARLRALLLRGGEGVEHQVEDLDHDACSLDCIAMRAA